VDIPPREADSGGVGNTENCKTNSVTDHISTGQGHIVARPQLGKLRTDPMYSAAWADDQLAVLSF
jgi:hypothetical protein